MQIGLPGDIESILVISLSNLLAQFGKQSYQLWHLRRCLVIGFEVHDVDSRVNENYKSSA